jgi:hypothetical protein
MRPNSALVIAVMYLSCAPAFAQSLFVGTWRPDPQRPGASAPPDVLLLQDGVYDCKSCEPPYSIRANGEDQAVLGNPRYDSVSVSVVDDRTIVKTAKKGVVTIAQSRSVVAGDGKTKTEVQTITGMAPRPFDMAIKYERVSPGPAGSHAVSGEWRIVEADLVHHEEDTRYQFAGGSLSMSDGLGRSFTARLDGTDAPYQGDPRYTTVSLKLVDQRTLEETDKHDGQVSLVTRWSIDPDGKTMHVTFDDTHGFVQHQTGHRLP